MKSCIKKLCGLSLVCALALCLVACGGSKGESSDSSSSAKTASESQTVTFPVAYFNSTDSAACISQLESAGCTDVKANGDGSYTATVSADAFNKITEDLYAQIFEAADTLENDNDTYPDIDSVEMNQDFSQITITLNTDQASIEDTFAPAVVGVLAANYQQISGADAACHVELIGKSGTVLNEYDYPVTSA